MSLLAPLGLTDENSGAFAQDWLSGEGARVDSIDPSNGQPIARVRCASVAEYDRVVEASREAFLAWRRVPAPKRGLAVRAVGDALRTHKRALAELVCAENGKILTEAEGEVQEMIDVADFAVGLSRQLYGLTMPSERARHRMMEQWHPLGVVGCITAFNFPVAVWSWNALVAAVCGDTTLWKPSEKTPLTAIAVTRLANDVMRSLGHPPIFQLAVGGRELGARIADDRRIPLVSATGSCAMGRAVGEAVARRLGRSLLELGGNNAVIVMDDADLELAARSVAFAAAGTAGQRCTTTRRVLVHWKVMGAFVRRLTEIYEAIVVGDPRDGGTLMGPLVDEGAVKGMLNAVATAKAQGGEVLFGGARVDRPGSFVQPTIIRATAEMPIVQDETFAPILYVIGVADLDEAIAVQNGVSQGLSSSIFTNGLIAAERFLSSEGSDCGIANVNLGTSGAEIGGAFGGEKDTGGGRESGSDAWKAYMRRQTCTVHYGTELALAQGVRFDTTRRA